MSTFNEQLTFLPDNEYHYDRIKPKHLKEMTFGELKRLRKIGIRRKRDNRIALVVVIVLAIFFVIRTSGEFIPVLIFLVIFVGIFWGAAYYAKRRRLRSQYRRLSLIGILSRSLMNRSYKVTTTFNTFRSDNPEFEYRFARSPYSGASKYYYYNPYVSYDTNLKHEDSEIDGVKFKFNSFIKLKTKSGGVVREIITMNYKFYFKINFIMDQKDFNRLDQLLRDKVYLPQYDNFTFIEFPQDDVIRFKLKVFTPMEQFHPTDIPPIIQNFYHAIVNSYQEVFNKSLIPLKKR